MSARFLPAVDRAGGIERRAIQQGSRHFLFRYGHDRGTSWLTDCVWNFGPQSFHINAGVHRCSSIQQKATCHSHVGNNSRRAPATANTSDFHRKFVDVDATLLESRPSLAPAGFRSFANPPYPVSSLFISTIVHSLTWLVPRVQ